MEITELYHPQIAVQIGQYSFDQGIVIEVYSDQEAYFDWAKIRFTEQFQESIDLKRKDAATVELGYSGSFEEIFTGYVAQGYNSGGFANEVNLKDDMLLLEETPINNTFLDTTPQEMISYFLAQAGIVHFQLSTEVYQAKKQIPIRKMNVIQAINAVHTAWGIKQRFFFAEGVFYWGVVPKQAKVYTFEYGVNILDLQRIGGVWELETVAAPFVKHSHKIAIEHPQISGEFVVKKVVTRTNDSGFIRTFIYF
ncbi:MAG TPA: serine/arginine repetitive matrix protein 2 [Pseudoflavonifractor sp.]|nr:serine/arginine repetitive matrix protein 2 [Pseudoflavonifractor sp.]